MAITGLQADEQIMALALRSETTGSQLYAIDQTTGQATLVGTIPAGQPLRGLVILPAGPGSHVLRGVRPLRRC